MQDPRKEYLIIGCLEQGVLWKMPLSCLHPYSEFFESQQKLKLKILLLILYQLVCIFITFYVRNQYDSARNYSPQECFDNEDASTGEIIPGSWRQITSDDTGLRRLRSTPRNVLKNAKDIREEFMNYFMSARDSILCQNKYL